MSVALNRFAGQVAVITGGSRGIGILSFYTFLLLLYCFTSTSPHFIFSLFLIIIINRTWHCKEIRKRRSQDSIGGFIPQPTSRERIKRIRNWCHLCEGQRHWSQPSQGGSQFCCGGMFLLNTIIIWILKYITNKILL